MSLPCTLSNNTRLLIFGRTHTMYLPIDPKYTPPSERNWVKAVEILQRDDIDPFPVPNHRYTPLPDCQKHFHPFAKPANLPDLCVCIGCSKEACHCSLIVVCRLCQALSHPMCLWHRLDHDIRQNTRPCCSICSLPFSSDLLRSNFAPAAVDACRAIVIAGVEEAIQRNADRIVDHQAAVL